MVKRLLLLVVVLGIGSLSVVLWWHGHRGALVVTPIARPTAGTAGPVTKPSTPASKPTPPDYFTAIHRDNPAVSTTQPLAFAVELPDAAHLIFHVPVYVDPSGEIWITTDDAEPTAKALRKPGDASEHVIRDVPVFAHWWVGAGGDWQAAVVTKAADGKPGFDLITKIARQHLAEDRPFNWGAAISLNGRIVVPTDKGVSVFDIEPKIIEHYHLLPGMGANSNPPRAIPDTRGVLAWAPWESGHAGSSGISRFVDGAWTDLPGRDWPARPIELSILLDGTVLCLSSTSPPLPSTAPTTAPADDDVVVVAPATPDTPPAAVAPDHVDLTLHQLDPAPVDEAKVNELITQLDSDDGDVRQEAFNQLARYGPGIAPMLQKVQSHQRAEGQMRIGQLLQNTITPAMGGMLPVDGRLTVARRFPDGTVLFYAPAGVAVPTESDEPNIVSPAWITQRADGRMERPLPPALVQDQNPQATTLITLRDEWLVDDSNGVRRFFGNAFTPLLGDHDKRFSQLVAVTPLHRWVLKDPANPADTLIIDPLVADPTPRLPVWTIANSIAPVVPPAAAPGGAQPGGVQPGGVQPGGVQPGAVAPAGAGAPAGVGTDLLCTPGWDSANFPVVIHPQNDGNWELGEDSWKVLPPEEKVQTPGSVTSSAAAITTAAPTTSAADIPLLTAADGTRYYNGRDALDTVSPKGVRNRWPLPAAATGTADPILLETHEHLLFLFNQGGRLLRIKPTPGETEPFKLEATFTTDIPNGDHPERMWVDPADRICWITEDKTLVVMFPEGHIPKPIQNLRLGAAVP